MKVQSTASDRSTDWGPAPSPLSPLQLGRKPGIWPGCKWCDAAMDHGTSTPWEYHYNCWSGHLHRTALVEQGLAAHMGTQDRAPFCFLPG